MTETLDLAGPDWGDVLRRSRRYQRRRVVLQACVVAALAVAGVASAYALGHPVIDFGKAAPGGLREVDAFGSMQVGAPPGFAPGVLPNETRRIAAVRIDGKVRTLYVAPTKKGGFCYEWSGSGGGCSPTRRGDLSGGGLMGPYGVNVLEGTFFSAKGERLTAIFKDGARIDVPFFWVTAPIDAGFYLWRVPNAHRQAGTHLVAVALYDAHGKLIQRQQLPGPTPPARRMVIHHVAGYPPLQTEADADWSRRELLFAIRTPKGTRDGLWAVPKAGGGVCYTTDFSSGCLPATWPKDMPLLNLSIDAGRSLCCEVSPKVAHIEARFQDGDRVTLVPKDGGLLWSIPVAHYALGHRLVALVGYDAAGRAIAHGRVLKPAAQRGIYPCAAPKSYGYGVKMCP